MKNRKVLKWTNKYSGETGYVGTVSKKKGYFTNEPDVLKAKKYVTDAAINNDLETLKLFGEFENNDFAAEDLML